ncbi:MAG: Serine/threonine protein kinase PrkC, regulator of stationary phase [Myxococcales bacterium]|nr:Serine/threonine protein kinase PrkC, regulator of stationary phase [Myxococcales bacterium]
MSIADPIGVRSTVVSEGEDATLPDTGRSHGSSGRTAAADLGERYELGAVLGRGGMGEVRLARDTRIQRDVAVKLLRSHLRDEDTLGRFFREARVQGVLEHPAVVPVHDLGLDPAGNPYFVMKRLAGMTLADVLVSTDPALRARWPRRQLLARLIDICLAIEFAHTQGVIHRDLKPANIMLGDFGEAYVLDWGLARLSNVADGKPLVASISGDELGHTAAGDLLGTPGYMSPEQARGEPVDPRTDVFALGCVLFEILAGTYAMPRGIQALAITVSAQEHRPSSVVADVPPELDDLCGRATTAVPAERPTARQLADGIQAYLDGDRDTERRRELAQAHATAAREAMHADGSETTRAVAMREAGRALALDPQNATAQYVLSRLLLEPPREMPAEALRAADEERGETRQDVLRRAGHGYTGLLVATLVLLLFPLRQFWPVILTAATCGVAVVLTRNAARQPLPMRSPWFLVITAVTTFQLIFAGMLFGPILIMPIFMVGAIAAFLSQHTGFSPWIIILSFSAAVLVVLGAELLGITPSTIAFADGALIIKPLTVDFTPLTTTVILGLSVLTQIVNTSFIAVTTRRKTEQAQDRVHTQTWQIKQLVPPSFDTGPAAKQEPR